MRSYSHPVFVMSGKTVKVLHDREALVEILHTRRESACTTLLASEDAGDPVTVARDREVGESRSELCRVEDVVLAAARQELLGLLDRRVEKAADPERQLRDGGGPDPLADDVGGDVDRLVVGATVGVAGEPPS